MKKPATNWPKPENFKPIDAYKAVLLEVDGEKYLRFSRESLTTSYERHGEILKRFLVEMRIPRDDTIESGSDLFPSPKGDRYNVIAMGKVGMDFTDKEACFKGDSFDYSIPGFKEEHLPVIKELITDVAPDWKIKTK